MDGMIFRINDCCVDIVFDAEPVLVIASGGIDPFTGEEISWPNPRTYWSNGVVSDGDFWKVPE